MPIVNDWSAAFNKALYDVWGKIIVYIPNIVVAILVFAVGWIIAVIVGKLVEEFLKAVKLDRALKSAGIDEIVEKMGFTLKASSFLGALIKWFIIIIFFTTSLTILELQEVTAYLWEIVLNYLPRIIIAVIILMVAAILAQFVYNLVLGAAKASGIRSKKFLANFAKWAVWIAAFIIVLPQLGIAATFIYTLFTGLVFALSLAFGLAFGLGGREEAARILAKLRKELEEGEGNK